MQIDAKITSKNQITVPREVREALEIGPGDRLRFVRSGKGFTVVRHRARARDHFGALHDPSRAPIDVDDMAAGPGRAMIERHERALHGNDRDDRD